MAKAKVIELPTARTLESVLEARMIDQLDAFDATTTVLGKGGEALQVALYPGETRVKLIDAVAHYLTEKRKKGDGPEWGKAFRKGDD